MLRNLEINQIIKRNNLHYFYTKYREKLSNFTDFHGIFWFSMKISYNKDYKILYNQWDYDREDTNVEDGILHAFRREAMTSWFD